MIIIALTVFGWVTDQSGWAHGVEFSPDLFCHRSFRYYQWCGIQVTPKQTREWRSAVDEYVHENGFVSDADVDEPRWHFVHGFAPGWRGWVGIAKPFCLGVGCWKGSDQWVKWSEDHPDLAKIVWPQVVTWARHEQYGEVRTLFHIMDQEDATSPEDIREKIRLAEIVAHGRLETLPDP